MCHWNTVNWNCIIRKETLEEKLSEEEKHALSRLQKELSEQKKVELLFTDADLEKDITFFLSGHHVKPEECMLLATEPEEVAKYIENLVKKEKWKAHYYFGKFGQKIGVPLKWLLPQNFYENLMKKYNKLD